MSARTTDLASTLDKVSAAQESFFAKHDQFVAELDEGTGLDSSEKSRTRHGVTPTPTCD
jgi:hypothetical protein